MKSKHYGVNDLRGRAACDDLMVKWGLGRSPSSYRVLPKLLAVECDAKMIVLTFNLNTEEENGKK
jgi:hypothetical protein